MSGKSSETGQARFGDDWPSDSIVIEFGVKDADLASSLHRAGITKYLGVSRDAERINALQKHYPELAERWVVSRRRRVVLENNAQILILSGASALYVWKYRWVRHARRVGVRLEWRWHTFAALVGFLWHVMLRHFRFPRLVRFRGNSGQMRSLIVSRVRRQKTCYRSSLHFIPHRLGLENVFHAFDQKKVQYVVLRWFERLPRVGAEEDLDLLIADHSLSDAFAVLDAGPGITPCDVYSEHGLARADYRGTPYYPPHLARRILEGRVRHRDLCAVPNRWDYFHSLAYHAVYHKGTRSNLCRGGTGLPARGQPSHDYATTLRGMARRLGVDVEISLTGLDSYLQRSNWGPSPEALARMSAACRGNLWLRMLSSRLAPHVHDQGLTVFVLRARAVELGYRDRILAMIEQGGFEILATERLAAEDVKATAPRVRGGNWGAGAFDLSGGPPAAVVAAYDHKPLPLSWRQRRRFPERTNARIFIKEQIRDVIVSELPYGQSWNALHSSDHAAEAWHLIEVLAPGVMESVRDRLRQIHAGDQPASLMRRAA